MIKGWEILSEKTRGLGLESQTITFKINELIYYVYQSMVCIIVCISYAYLAPSEDKRASDFVERDTKANNLYVGMPLAYKTFIRQRGRHLVAKLQPIEWDKILEIISNISNKG